MMQSLGSVILLLALGFCAATTTIAGEIRGVVAPTGGKSTAPARYIVRGQLPKSEATTGGTSVAIAIQSLDVRTPPAIPDTPLVMAQENTAFVPNLLIVPLGARVTFPNHDAIFHNVFSYSPPRSFDLGRYPKGETRTVRFEETGVVRIFCEIHSSMFATILVVDTEHAQIVGPADGFSFPDLPGGRYRVVAVDAAGRKTRTDVRLDKDQTLNLSLYLE